MSMTKTIAVKCSNPRPTATGIDDTIDIDFDVENISGVVTITLESLNAEYWVSYAALEEIQGREDSSAILDKLADEAAACAEGYESRTECQIAIERLEDEIKALKHRVGVLEKFHKGKIFWDGNQWAVFGEEKWDVKA